MAENVKRNALCLPVQEQPEGEEADDRPDWVKALDNPKYIH